MKRLFILLPLIFIQSLFLRGQDNCKYYFGINSITSITSSDEEVYIGTDSRIIVMNKTSISKKYLTPLSIDYSESVPSYFSLHFNKVIDKLICIGGHRQNHKPNHVLYEIQSTISDIKYESGALKYCNVDNSGDIWVIGGYRGSSYLKCITSNDTLTYQYAIDTIYNPDPEFIYADFNEFDSDSNNNKWLGTSNGLCKLDSCFTYIKCDLNINSYQINKIAIDKDDHKWMTTSSNDGLVKYDNENWQIFNTNNSDIPSDTIFEIEVDTFGYIWAATSNGLAKYDNNTWITYNINNSDIEDSYVTTLHIDDQNVKWLGTLTNKLIKFNDISFETMDLGDSPIKNNFFHALHYYEDTIYAGGYGKDIKSINNFEISTHLTYEDKPESSYFTSILIDDNQTYYTFFGTSIDACGMLFVNQDTSIFYNYLNTPEMYIPGWGNTPLYYLTKDNQGNLWMSISTGILKFKNDEWTIYNSDNSIIPAYAFCRGISIDSSGNIMAAFNHEIMKFNNGLWENIDIAAINPYDIEIFSFIVDRNNNYIIGTRENGIFIYNGSDWQNFNIENSELPGNEIWCMEIDSANNMWAGTNGGLVKYDYSQWTIYSVENSFVPVTNIIYDIQIDGNNNIWFVNKAGITVFKQDWGKWIDVEKKNRYELKVYPNPSKDIINIVSAPGDIIKVYNINGLLMETINNKENLHRLDITKYSAGVYIIKLEAQGVEGSKRFIKL